MVRIFVLAASLILLTGAANAEDYVGDLVYRDGVHYKPDSVEPFSGVQRGWYENGQLVHAYNFREFQNGQLRNEASWKNEQFDGVLRMWHENRQLKSESPLKNGRTHGLARSWYENGQLKSETPHKNGSISGVSREWRENGELEETWCWSDSEIVDMSECETNDP